MKDLVVARHVVGVNPTPTVASRELRRHMTDDRRRLERFRTIYTSQYDDLWRYCLRRTRSPQDAEDVLGDVFAVAWKRIDDIPDADGARPWLFTVAHNHLRNAWRTRERGRALDDRLRNDSIEWVGAVSSESSGSADSVLEALGRLSDADSEILRLAVWDEVSHREIALILECTENAVGIRLHRARSRLAAQLVQQSGSPEPSDDDADFSPGPALDRAPAPTSEGERHE